MQKKVAAVLRCRSLFGFQSDGLVSTRDCETCFTGSTTIQLVWNTRQPFLAQSGRTEVFKTALCLNHFCRIEFYVGLGEIFNHGFDVEKGVSILNLSLLLLHYQLSFVWIWKLSIWLFDVWCMSLQNVFCWSVLYACMYVCVKVHLQRLCTFENRSRILLARQENTNITGMYVYLTYIEDLIKKSFPGLNELGTESQHVTTILAE